MSRPRRLRSFADYEQKVSLALAFRLRRFLLIRTLLATLSRPLKIIDVGGTEEFWQLMGYSEEPQITFTIVNREPPIITRPNFAGLVGDARNLSAVLDNSFDVAFSNSTIEHVGSFADQQRMAAELRRVAPRYFLQTPYKFFPIEQHWMLPLVQFAPFAVRYQIAKRFGTGAFADLSDDEAIEVSSVNLLGVRELQQLFPEAVLVRETVIGLTKSLMVHCGF